ncbi:MAG: glycoside hydrolase family 31 protein, partial [Phycisphaerales bacterium]
MRNILWQVPVLHPASPLFADAERNGYLVRRPDGSVSFREHWLAGFANIDMTNPAAVAWWQDLMRPLVRAGVAGFKADDGEDIKPTDVFHDTRRGWQLHNEYSVLYARAIAELFEQEHVDGILWARSGSLGQQRYPALWAGDQAATWGQMRTLIPAGLSAGLSGMPFWGHDIGGYAGQPSPELYIRWVQLGTLSPMMQYHGIHAREPWLFGDEAEDAYTLAARARTRLIPYLQAAADVATDTGVPIMRPMSLPFPDDPRFAHEDTQYMLGDDLLVAPVLTPGSPGREVLIPAGRWRLATQRVEYQGPAKVRVPIGLVDLPVLVRADASIELVEQSESAPMLTDLSVPLRASTAPTPVSVRFRAPDPGDIRVQWRWRDAGTWRAAPITAVGRAVTVDLTPPPEERTPGRRQVYRVFCGQTGSPAELLHTEVWYQTPIEFEVVGPPPTIGSVPASIAVRVRNTVDEPFEGTARWVSEDARAAGPASRDVRLAPGETTTLTWSTARSNDRVG